MYFRPLPGTELMQIHGFVRQTEGEVWCMYIMPYVGQKSLFPTWKMSPFLLTVPHSYNRAKTQTNPALFSFLLWIEFCRACERCQKDSPADWITLCIHRPGNVPAARALAFFFYSPAKGVWFWPGETSWEGQKVAYSTWFLGLSVETGKQAARGR